jgi:hypothetical protein
MSGFHSKMFPARLFATKSELKHVPVKRGNRCVLFLCIGIRRRRRLNFWGERLRKDNTTPVAGTGPCFSKEVEANRLELPEFGVSRVSLWPVKGGRVCRKKRGKGWNDEWSCFVPWMIDCGCVCRALTSQPGLLEPY